MIDSDEIRKKIAMQHNILLDKDDPLFIAASVNEAILTRFVEILTEQNEVLLKKLQAAQVQGLAEAKATGGRVITDASNYVREQVKAAVEEALGKGEAQIKRDLAGSRKALHTLRKTAVIAAAVSCICTVATVAVAINVF
jgi:hypothetical protein